MCPYPTTHLKLIVVEILPGKKDNYHDLNFNAVLWIQKFFICKAAGTVQVKMLRIYVISNIPISHHGVKKLSLYPLFSVIEYKKIFP